SRCATCRPRRPFSTSRWSTTAGCAAGRSSACPSTKSARRSRRAEPRRSDPLGTRLVKPRTRLRVLASAISLRRRSAQEGDRRAAAARAPVRLLEAADVRRAREVLPDRVAQRARAHAVDDAHAGLILEHRLVEEGLEL